MKSKYPPDDGKPPIGHDMTKWFIIKRNFKDPVNGTTGMRWHVVPPYRYANGNLVPENVRGAVFDTGAEAFESFAAGHRVHHAHA